MERHIDHLTHQYQLAQQTVNQAKDEQHQLLNDIQSHRTLSYNLEVTS